MLEAVIGELADIIPLAVILFNTTESIALDM